MKPLRVLAVYALSCALAFGLAACGSDDNSSSSSGSTTATAKKGGTISGA
ncbi:MAG: hypothetical protein QOJ35_546, partial [Solirubrobacteraceae bacterium]|nr:hypothetical protein [Solirubrobacteraceae bacterium]